MSSGLSDVTRVLIKTFPTGSLNSRLRTPVSFTYRRIGPESCEVLLSLKKEREIIIIIVPSLPSNTNIIVSMVTALLFIVNEVITFSALRINKQRERAILGYFLIMKVFPLTIK